jgi:amino acid transporter
LPCQRALTARSTLAAGDDGKKKEALLSFYFEYGTHIASLVIIGLVMSIVAFAFAVSLSSALQLQTNALVVVLSLTPLAVLILVLAWFAFSAHGYLATKRTPSALLERLSRGTTIWIDKTCVDQNNIEGFLDNGIDHFMLLCNHLMAFPSKSCTRPKKRHRMPLARA